MRVVVIGGGPAGMAAASRVRKHSPEIEVMVIERTRYVSFALCGTPYFVGGIIRSVDDLLYYPPKYFEEKRRIRLELESEAVEIRPSERKVVYKKGGEEREVEYDRLIVATGARSKLPSIPGIDEEGVMTSHHIDDSVRLKERLLNAKRVAIIGAGLKGLEFAENISFLGKEVEIFELHDRPIPKGLDRDAGEVLMGLIGEKVRIHLNSPVNGIRRSGDRLLVESGDGSGDFDLVLVFTGIEPNVDLLREAGAEIGETGAVSVDSKMRTSLPDVFAAGDNVEAINRVTGRPDWMPFAQIANKMGLVAGANAAGKDVEFPGAVRTWTTEVFGVEVAGTGLTEEEARRLGIEAEGVLIRGRNKAHYMPGSEHLWMKLVVSEGRIIGAQAIGRGALARVNSVAVMLPYGPSPKDLIFADIGYAPPLAPVWDPVVVAGRQFDPVL